MHEAHPQPLDPELAEVFGVIPPLALTPEALPSIRAAIAFRPELPDRVIRTDHRVAGRPPVALRVHRPAGVGGSLPCVYSMHGGGFVLGSHDMDDALFDRWCSVLRVTGVSVDYRLAPETPYPGPLEDCYAGLRWVFEHADELGVDTRCVGVRGLSAGGGLAAALALLARDREEFPLRFQLLDSPMLDDRRVTPSSRLEELPMWSRESNEFGWRSYLGDLFGAAEVPEYAAPARAADLRGLPAGFVSVGSVDGFRDEAVDYALRLNQAGVPTELHLYTGAPHGYQLAEQADVTRRSDRDMEEWLIRRLTATAAPNQG